MYGARLELRCANGVVCVKLLEGAGQHRAASARNRLRDRGAESRTEGESGAAREGWRRTGAGQTAHADAGRPAALLRAGDSARRVM